jgi:hypothetical protein
MTSVNAQHEALLDELLKDYTDPKDILGIGQKYAPDFMRIRERRGNSTWASDRQKGFSCFV